MIRTAKINDLKEINALGKLIYPNFENVYNVKNYLANENFIILVNVDIHINGIIICYKNVDYYELELIVVDVNYRNRGIANNLIDYFINNYVKINGVILLEVSVENEAALNLYKKHNFEIINIRKKYYNGVDAYVMKKVI